jgi:hypothetical protein
MTKHATKAALVEDVRAVRGRLEKTLAELSPEEIIRPGVIGDWSAKDVMAHLMDWEQRFVGWYEAGARGETPETPAPGLSWRQLDILNQRIFEQYQEMPLEEVMAKSEASYQKILALIESIPEAELFEPGRYAWLNGDQLANWAAANTCEHYNWARTQIRKVIQTRA